MRKLLLTCLITFLCVENNEYASPVPYALRWEKTQKAEQKAKMDSMQAANLVLEMNTKAVHQNLLTWDSVKNVIKAREGLMLKPYVCPGGYKSVGYGHVITDDILNRGVTVAQADSLLSYDLEYCRKWVEKTLKLKGGKLKAISHFCFGVGTTQLYRSTLFKKIKNGEPIDEELLKWCKINGKRSSVLYKARVKELAWYNAG